MILILERINYLHAIPDQYLKKQKVIKLLELWTLWLKEKKIVYTKEEDIDARGNKLSSCKIPVQYLKKQKVIKL